MVTKIRSRVLIPCYLKTRDMIFVTMTLHEAHSLLLTKVEKKKTHHTIKTRVFLYCASMNSRVMNGLLYSVKSGEKEFV